MAQVVALKSGGKVAGIIPQTVEEVFRLAQAVSISGLAPKGMNTPEQITVAILHGAELGIPPMQAIQKIAVINGRPTVWGDAIIAMLWGSGFEVFEWMEGKDLERVARCRVTRPTGEHIERSFSVADAKKAGLWGKAGPWSQYPDRMLQMRARGFAARDGAADVLGGLYLREEIDEVEPRDITPEGPPLTGPRRTAHSVRKSGDYERFETAVRACKTTDQLSAVLDEWKALLQTMPESWEANANAFVVQFRQMMTATTVEPEPEDELELNPDAFLEKLRFDIANCDDVQELGLIAESNAEQIARLPTEHKIEAARMLKEAAE